MLSISLNRRPLVFAGLALAASLMAGCSAMTSTDATTYQGQAVLGGNVHGGQQPISGATVALYAAGNYGYGSATPALATTTTDSGGNFSFQPSGVASYSCPASNSSTQSQYLYLVVSGGQPTPGITNNDAALMAVLGDCSTVLSQNPFVIVNEVTTIAGMFALQQFFSPDIAGLGYFGTSSTNITGLANAMATAKNLANIGAGQSQVSTVSGTLSSYSTNPTVTITPEIAKINTEADILSACINSNPGSSNNCATLLSSVSADPAQDTLQAAYYMAINPTSTLSGASNIGTLYGLQTAQPAFAPVLSSQPTDWTLGITYGSSSTSTAGVYLMNNPAYLAVDATGNIWMVNDSSTSATSTANSVTEISPTGTPLAQVFTGAGVLAGPGGIAVDASDNVWVPNYGSTSTLQSNVVEYTGGATRTFTTNKGPQRLILDAGGNAFVLEPSSTGFGDLEEIPAGSTTGVTATTIASGLTTGNSNLAIDSNYTIWITGGGTGSSGGTSGYPYVYQFQYSSTSPNYPSTPSNTTNVGGITEPEQSISIDNSNNVFVQNYGATNVAEFSGQATVLGNNNAPYTVQSGLTSPEFQITDGAGDLWVTDGISGGAVYEITNSGTFIAPSTGYAHTYDIPYGIALDSSGNVWVGAYSANGPNGFLTEIVGQAAPVVTPLSAGLPATASGNSKLATRP